jgi:hypothetical protein
LFEELVPNVIQPFVDTWAWVKVVPFITKLNPIGIPLKNPSSISEGVIEVAPDNVVYVPEDALNV